MSDTWIILKPERTVQKVKYPMNDFLGITEKYERCMICYATECELIGVYGAYNEFGSFKGVCNKCLEKLNKTKAEG